MITWWWMKAKHLKMQLSTWEGDQQWREKSPLLHEACLVAHFPAPLFAYLHAPRLAFVTGPKRKKTRKLLLVLLLPSLLLILLSL